MSHSLLHKDTGTFSLSSKNGPSKDFYILCKDIQFLNHFLISSYFFPVQISSGRNHAVCVCLMSVSRGRGETFMKK